MKPVRTMPARAFDPSAWGAQPVGLIACDWNGTLVDDVERARAATSDVMRQLGLPSLDLDMLRATFVLPLPLFFVTLGVPGPLLERAEILWNRRLCARPAFSAPGAAAFLAVARRAGVDVGVISAATTTVVEQDAEALGMRLQLAFVTGGVSSKREVLRGLVEATIGSVLYVGDTEYDVSEASAAGAVPVGVTWGYRPAEALWAAGAVAVVENLADLTLVAGITAEGPGIG